MDSGACLSAQILKLTQIYSDFNNFICEIKCTLSKFFACIVLQCSKTCGSGSRKRQVVCRSHHQRLSDRFCDVTTRPDDFEQCILAPCFNKLHWYISPWSQVRLATEVIIMILVKRPKRNLSVMLAAYVQFISRNKGQREKFVIYSFVVN